MSRLLFYSLLAVTLGTCAPEDNIDKTRPNIVLIYTDDQTHETIGALGNNLIRTPNMDRLVNSGTTFTHAYNMGGWHGAVCVASRSMMISGTTLWRARQLENRWREKDSTAIAQTWGRLLASQGYNSYMTGKWHVNAPAKLVFDTVVHERPGMPGDFRGELGPAIKKWENESAKMEDWNDYMPLGYGRPKAESDNSWSPTDTTLGGFWEGGKHWSEVVRDDALAFIEDAGENDDPFFMYLAFNAPHDPRQAPQRFIDMYPIENIPVPENFLPEHPWKDSIGNSPSLRDEALAPYPRTEYAIKTHMQEYYAIISHLDHQVGMILDALETSGKMENTYIFFTSDHGLSVGQHGLLGKQSLYDHSVRVPLIVTGPDVPKGQKLRQDVYLQDIMATSLELAGIERPSYLEFNSFLDLINGEAEESHYKAIYGAYVDYQRMIRKDGFKLLIFPKAGQVLLFDMQNDPLELNNLADRPEYSEKVGELFMELLDLQKVMGDDLDLTMIFNEVPGVN